MTSYLHVDLPADRLIRILAQDVACKRISRSIAVNVLFAWRCDLENDVPLLDAEIQSLTKDATAF